MTLLESACLVIIAACLIPCYYRLAVGPHTVDRLLAFDLSGVLIATLLAILALVQDSWVYLEISMGLVVLAFVGTLAIAQYVQRGRLF